MDKEKDNSYSIIESNKDVIKDNDWWVLGKQEGNEKSAEDSLEKPAEENAQEKPVPVKTQ